MLKIKNGFYIDTTRTFEIKCSSIRECQFNNNSEHNISFLFDIEISNFSFKSYEIEVKFNDINLDDKFKDFLSIFNKEDTPKLNSVINKEKVRIKEYLNQKIDDWINWKDSKLSFMDYMNAILDKNKIFKPSYKIQDSYITLTFWNGFKFFYNTNISDLKSFITGDKEKELNKLLSNEKDFSNQDNFYDTLEDIFRK